METNIYLTADRFPLVRDIGKNQITGIYTHPDRIQDFDVFLFVTKGEMQVIEEGTEYIVKEKEHLFLKKGLHHWGLPRKTMPETSWYWIHFNAMADDHSTYKEYSILPELDYFSPSDYQYRFMLPKYGYWPQYETIEHRLNSLLEDYYQVREHRMTHICIQSYLLFMDLHRASLKPFLGNAGGRSDTIAERVMRYLLKNTERDFDAQALSKHLNLNYSYISSAFKKQTGQSVIEAHTKLRINKAIELMKNSSLIVSEISDKLGFPNPYYFSRVFKKVLGESPTSYMKQIYKT